MKSESSRDLTVGGSTLAAHAFTAGLVDECHLFICPVGVGRGKPSLPSDLPAKLELLDERRFDAGDVYVRYGLRTERRAVAASTHCSAVNTDSLSLARLTLTPVGCRSNDQVDRSPGSSAIRLIMPRDR